MPALQLDHVHKVYGHGDQQVVALRDVSLTVGHDEVVILVGPSGSGKTTLLTVAGALLRPTSGRVTVGGTDITTLADKQLAAFRREEIGFVFQSVNLVPFLTAKENLLVVRQFGGSRIDAEASRRADQLLDELGLGGRTGNLPSQLSGGEKQRVAIGRALMNDPSLVLVDEPTSALDSELGKQVMELLRREIKSRGVSAIIVTHDDRVLQYGDRTERIVDGALESSADHRVDPDELLSRHGKSIRAAYLRIRPRTTPPRALMRSLRRSLSQEEYEVAARYLRGSGAAGDDGRATRRELQRSLEAAYGRRRKRPSR